MYYYVVQTLSSVSKATRENVTSMTRLQGVALGWLQ